MNMAILDLLGLIIYYVIVAIIVGVIVVVLLRVVVEYLDLNPFSWTKITVRRFSDPLVNPVRRGLMRWGVDQKFAPLVTILIAVLVGWFLWKLIAAVLFTISGIMASVLLRAPVMLVGYILFGILAVYSLLIIMRVVFSWGMNYGSRLMRFLILVTEPLLGPARRMIPSVGMMDISPIIVILLLQLLQNAVAEMLIR
ncbi:MAG: YggT family protein [Blastocatellia bacterium]|jgi:YggT family protein|nr:YggT family protein [Blastocatellia bacterium]